MCKHYWSSHQPFLWITILFMYQDEGNVKNQERHSYIQQLMTIVKHLYSVCRFLHLGKVSLLVTQAALSYDEPGSDSCAV